MKPEFAKQCTRLDELLDRGDDLSDAESEELESLVGLLVHPDYQSYRRALVEATGKSAQ
jgi:hypothetical protein